jgi:hypothetical protein
LSPKLSANILSKLCAKNIKSKTDESMHCYKIRKASHKNIDLNKINKIIILKKTQSALGQGMSKVLFYVSLSVRNETSVEFFSLS